MKRQNYFSILVIITAVIVFATLQFPGRSSASGSKSHLLAITITPSLTSEPPTPTNTLAPRATRTPRPTRTSDPQWPFATATDPVADPGNGEDPGTQPTPDPSAGRTSPGGKGNLSLVSFWVFMGGFAALMITWWMSPYFQRVIIEPDVSFKNTGPVPVTFSTPFRIKNRWKWVLQLLIFACIILILSYVVIHLNLVVGLKTHEISINSRPVLNVNSELPADVHKPQSPVSSLPVGNLAVQSSAAPSISDNQEARVLPNLEAALEFTPQGAETLNISRYDFYGIDFSSSAERIKFEILSPTGDVNQGKPVVLSFIPGNTCIFGDQQACVYPHQAWGQNMIFLTIHSGVGGEGQEFRHVIEGTGLNRAKFAITKIQSNIASMLGSEVAMGQGSTQVAGLSLVGLTRIPPSHVQRYLNLSAFEAFSLALARDPVLMQSIDLSRPMIVFEVCGWKLNQEDWYPGITSTSGSIYMGIIQ